MFVVEVVLIAIGLSLDVFAYALCKGAVMPGIRKDDVCKMCAIFTAWQVGSLLLGNLITLVPLISRSSEEAALHWKQFSVSIFLILGIYMILKAAMRQERIEEKKEERVSVRQIIVWAFITSVDSLLAGIGFGFLKMDFLVTFPLLAITTVGAVLGGVFTGYWMGCQFKRKAVTLGGCMILIGGLEMIIRTFR